METIKQKRKDLFNKNIKMRKKFILNYKNKLSKETISEKVKSYSFIKGIEFLANNETIFDWMTFESYLIILKAIAISKKLNILEVNTDCVLLAFFSKDITKKIHSFRILESNEFNSLKKFVLKQNYKKYEKNFKQEIKYNEAIIGEELLAFFIEISLKAMEKFRTLIITPEIILYSLLEEQKELFILSSQKTLYYELRHFLLKEIYFEEKALREELDKKNYIYSLFLKLNITMIPFRNIIKTTIDSFFTNCIYDLRNKILLSLEKLNTDKVLSNQIILSIKENRDKTG